MKLAKLTKLHITCGLWRMEIPLNFLILDHLLDNLCSQFVITDYIAVATSLFKSQITLQFYLYY